MRKNDRGFSLVEMMIVIAIMMILAAITVPALMNVVNDVNLRYAATNMSGLLQTARIQAVRRNTFYGILPTLLPAGDVAYFVDLQKTGVYVPTDPVAPFGTQLQVTQGIGSGAPNEGAFVAGLGYGVLPGGQRPTFNARGLPCSPNVANTICAQNAGQGFVVFMKRTSSLGDIRWASVAITPSGRVKVYSCDGAGNWVQR